MTKSSARREQLTSRPAERQRFILDHLRANGLADTLDRDFVVAYIQATDAPSRGNPFGAPSCPTLGRDLSALYRQGKVARSRCGLSGHEVGFPRWVYVYELAEARDNARTEVVRHRLPAGVSQLKPLSLTDPAASPHLVAQACVMPIRKS